MAMLAKCRSGEALAEQIRERSLAAQLTSHRTIETTQEHAEKLLAEMDSMKSCADICTIKGVKDTYYYSAENMTGNYAMIAMLVEEKNLARTIAHMVRWNCKTYPVPTPLTYFTRQPYYMTMEQIRTAVREISADPSCEDIQQIRTVNGNEYLHSTRHMSGKYAKALADDMDMGAQDR